MTEKNEKRTAAARTSVQLDFDSAAADCFCTTCPPPRHRIGRASARRLCKAQEPTPAAAARPRPSPQTHVPHGPSLQLRFALDNRLLLLSIEHPCRAWDISVLAGRPPVAIAGGLRSWWQPRRLAQLRSQMSPALD